MKKSCIKNNKYITATIWGGLGNQLFIYSACRRLSIKSGLKLFIDDISGFKIDKKYKRKNELDNFHIPFYSDNINLKEKKIFTPLKRKIIKILNKPLPLNYKSYIHQRSTDFDDQLLKIKPKRDLRIEGYWQSENYFFDIENEIRNDLKFINQFNAENIKYKDLIKYENSIAIHLREPNKNLLNLEKRDLTEYYFKAINLINDKISNAYFFIFGDLTSYPYLKEKLNKKKFKIIINKKPTEDLYLMSLCKHFIIADSTFSWWGAWLSRNVDKIIIAPGYKDYNSERNWGFKGLIPRKWIVL